MKAQVIVQMKGEKKKRAGNLIVGAKGHLGASPSINVAFLGFTPSDSSFDAAFVSEVEARAVAEGLMDATDDVAYTAGRVANVEYKGHERVAFVEHCPGNATAYLCVAVRMPLRRGQEHATWCVAFPTWGSSYFVEEGTYLHPSYVAEKFSMNNHAPNDVDALQLARAIARVVPGVTTA